MFTIHICGENFALFLFCLFEICLIRLNIFYVQKKNFTFHFYLILIKYCQGVNGFAFSTQLKAFKNSHFLQCNHCLFYPPSGIFFCVRTVDTSHHKTPLQIQVSSLACLSLFSVDHLIVVFQLTHTYNTHPGHT